MFGIKEVSYNLEPEVWYFESVRRLLDRSFESARRLGARSLALRKYQTT